MSDSSNPLPVAVSDAAINLSPVTTLGDNAVAVTSEKTNLPALIPQRLPTVITRTSFTAAQLTEIVGIAQATSVANTASIMTFGAAPQQKLSRYLDELLGDSTIGAAGVGGEITTELSRGIDRMNLRKMRLEVDGKDMVARIFGGWPIIGKYVSALRAFMLDRSLIVAEFDRIQSRAQGEQTRLIDATSKFDGLIRHMEGMLKDVEVHIAAGEDVRDREHKVYVLERSALMAVPVSDRDPARVGRFRDHGERLIQFEVRLLNLAKAYLEGIQGIPEIRNLAKSSEIEIQNVMESILSDIPRLKRAVLQMVGLTDLRKAREGTAARRKLSNEMAEIASEASSRAYLEAKESQGDFADELDRLDRQAALLLATLKKGSEIDLANKVKRDAARDRIIVMKDTFVKNMTETQNSL